MEERRPVPRACYQVHGLHPARDIFLVEGHERSIHLQALLVLCVCVCVCVCVDGGLSYMRNPHMSE